MFHAAQIFYRAGIVSAMNALHFTPEAKHEIHLSVNRVQQIKIVFFLNVFSIIIIRL